MDFVLMLALFLAAVWLYVAWRFARGLPGSRGVRWAVALLLLVMAEYRLWASAIFGGAPAQVLPRPALIVLAWAFGGFLLLAMLMLLRDILGLLAWPLHKRVGRRILAGGWHVVGIGVLAALLAGWGVYQAVKVPAVKRVSVTVPHLPPAFDGYRIAQLSDLHATRLLPAWWQAAVVRRTNALDANLIVITGDLEDGTPAARGADVRPLGNLRASDGVLAVPGNHEYYAGAYRGWIKLFRQLGLDVLENAHVVIHHDGAALGVVGLTDRAADHLGLPGPDLAEARRGLAPDMPFIVLMHRPDTARAIARSGALLELAGHTHGGQIVGPSLLTKWANEGFVSGLYKVGTMRLYVSNGTGLWAGLAIRLGRPSEITLITLHAGT